MKTICLVRHAKASQQFFDLADIDRPLIERGYKDAHAMSIKLAVTGFMPGLMVSSPGIRALTTALIFARNLKYPAGSVVLNEQLYNATIQNMVEVVHELPETTAGVMIFGHNPSITHIANLLAGEFVEHVPTCGICCIDFEISSWHKIAPGAGKLRFFDYPKNNAF